MSLGELGRRAAIVVAALGLALMGGGCSRAVKTKAYNPGPEKLSKGVIYYLPSGRIRLEISEGRDNQDRVSFQLRTMPTEYYSDTSLPLVLDYSSPLGADETFCVSRGSDGLLTKIEVDSADRTGDIIVKIAETVATAVLRVPSGGGLRTAARTVKPPAPREPITLVFDPCSKDDREIKAARGRLEEWFGDGTKVTFKFPECGKPKETIAKCELGSACYRSKTKILFSVDASDVPVSPGGLGKVHADLTADYPANDHVGVVDLKRTVLTRTVSSLGFESGMLTEFGVSRGSPLYEAARLPLRVINAVLDVPVSFFNKIAAGFKSEAAANQAAAELIKAQAELEKVRKDSQTPTSPPSGPGQGSGDIGSTPSPPAAFVSDKVCKGKGTGS